MNKKERLHNNNGNNVVEMVALYMERRLNKEDMSPENQAILEFYVGIIPDDLEFAEMINIRRKAIVSTEGQRTSLFPAGVIENISKRKKKRKQEEKLFQLSLWAENKEESEVVSELEPRDKVMEAGKELTEYLREIIDLLSRKLNIKKRI